MAYAWTYVDNTGGGRFCYLGVAADDGSVVYLNGAYVGMTTGWHNNMLVHTAIPVYLPPGNNLIMIKIFEGGGGHNIRVRLQDNDQTGDVSGTPGLSESDVQL
jgi:hypothetical protein